MLPEGLVFNPISLTPESLDLLNTKKFSVLEISRLFGVPPFLLGEVEKGASFASSKEAVRAFARSAIAPMCTRLEQAITRACLPQGCSLEFDLSQLLRSDPETRWGTHQIARNIGVMSVNEIRNIEGLSKLVDASANSHEPLNQSPTAAGTTPAAPKPNGHDPAPLAEPPLEDDA